MSRTSFTGRLATALAAASALAVAACSDVPVQPDAAGPAPTSPALAKASADDDVVAGEVIVTAQGRRGDRRGRSRHGLAKGRSGTARHTRSSSPAGQRARDGGPPRRRSRRRVRGAELHPPRRRGSATMGVLQPGRVEHVVLTTTRAGGPARSRRATRRYWTPTRIRSRVSRLVAATSSSARSTRAWTSTTPSSAVAPSPASTRCTTTATPTDCEGHGTHVAGTVGGATYGVARASALVARERARLRRLRQLERRASPASTG